MQQAAAAKFLTLTDLDTKLPFYELVSEVSPLKGSFLTHTTSGINWGQGGGGGGSVMTAMLVKFVDQLYILHG